MGNHTPGPWKLFDDRRMSIVRLDDGELIADLDIIVNGQEDANARLIVASPELLDALRAITAGYAALAGAFRNPEEEEEVIAARAAIAEATGAEPARGSTESSTPNGDT